MTDLDLMWLAGYLEGEGCFHLGKNKRKERIYYVARISVVSVDLDVIERAAQLMGCKAREVQRRTVRCKVIYRSEIAGVKALVLMATLQPYMGQRRQAKIAEIINTCEQRLGIASGVRCGQAKLNEEAVMEIRRLGANGNRVQSELARKHGVSQAAVWYVLNGRSWKHVQSEAIG